MADGVRNGHSRSLQGVSDSKNPPVPRNRGTFAFWGEELLLQGLLNSNGHGDGHADHGVVTSAQEASQAPLAVRKTPEIM